MDVSGRCILRQKLNRPHAITTDLDQQVEAPRRPRVEPPPNSLAYTGIVRKQILKKLLHAFAIGFSRWTQRKGQRDGPRIRRSEPRLRISELVPIATGEAPLADMFTVHPDCQGTHVSSTSHSYQSVWSWVFFRSRITS